MAAPSMNTVCGFRVMPVKFNAKSDVVRYFYYKVHNAKQGDDTKPAEKTLLVVNVPPYCNEECLERLFSSCGKVERVQFQQRIGQDDRKPQAQTLKTFTEKHVIKGYKVAYVTFGKEIALKKAKAMKYPEPLLLSTDQYPVLTGMKKWCKDYFDSWPDAKEMQKDIDQYMADYDKRKLEEEEQEAEDEGVPDEDGWVTVTRKGRNPGVARTEANQKKAMAKEKQQNQKKELLNFYRFQYRESQREHIAQLRKKFEEDKQKIANMKSARKFKPY
ncbi:ribosomal RNA-processing protein 7 homolog A-like [Ptychodera flava]|uniref:ribosomal RNA-processing protein 7 homolog A-like n=1 Tax=Ptychodera flava TaxID=63121 RepID=UPI003969FB17